MGRRARTRAGRGRGDTDERGIPSAAIARRHDLLVGEVGSAARLWLNRRLPEILAKHLALEGIRVLDVGCGSGAAAAQLAAAGAKGSYVGCDIAARAEWDPRTLGELSVEFAEVPAERLDTLGRRFNAAVSIMAFEHLENDAAALTVLARVVQPGGTIVIAVPAPASRVYLGPRHAFRWYDVAAIRRLAGAAGLRVVEIATHRGGLGLAVDALRYWFFTLLARGLRLAVYARHRGDAASALAHSPWLRVVNDRLNNWWLSVGGGRVARGVAAAAYRADAATSWTDVSHIAVLQKPPT